LFFPETFKLGVVSSWSGEGEVAAAASSH